TDSVVIIDAEKLVRSTTDRLGGVKAGPLDRYGAGEGPEYPDDLTAQRQFVLARLPVQANPRRLALSGDGKWLVVSNHLADSLTVIDTTTLKVVRHIPLGGPAPNAARRGEVLFNSAKLTFQQQFSCASCHPDGA